VNELGVSEPVIQQQGSDRIVVELPGVQDTAKAKDIIGRTATLEARLADPTNTHPGPNDPVPPGDELFTQGNNGPTLVRKQVIFTGDRIIDASAGFDEHQRPSVNIRLDAAGGRAVSSVSRDNIGKPMAMILFEKGKGEVLTVATIQSELGDRFQITGALAASSRRPGAAAARGFARGAHGHHRRTHDRPEPGRRQHQQGLRFRAVRFRRDRRLHDRVLHAVRPDLHVVAVGEPVAAGRHSVDAASHADAAGYCGYCTGARYGDRRQRADQRTDPRGTA
jgi:hypothetical protein